MSKNQFNILSTSLAKIDDMGREIPGMGDEFELSLELSIGGPYSQSQTKNLERERPGEPTNRDIPRSGFSAVQIKSDAAAEDSCGFPDLHTRREIQALRRREARMKREAKKSSDDRLLLEAQQFHARVEGRESRERDGFPERKRDKLGARKAANALSFGENKVPEPKQAQFLLPVVNGFACPWVVPLWVGGERDGNEAAPPQLSSSAAVSLQRKGESCSDSGSQSSDKQGEGIGTSTSTAVVNESNLRDTSCSTANALHMPCVSTTGNGPNGKTITGFLHKYTKSQVTIMCVCHGTFFTPAEFVEHAGGVDITHPLRHITVLPSILQ